MCFSFKKEKIHAHPFLNIYISKYTYLHYSDCCNKSNQLTRASLVSHVVNLRKRIKDNENDTPCGSAENAIGNLLWLAFAKSNMADKNDNNNNNEKRLYGLVKKLRKALSTINEEFIENMRSCDNFTRKSTMLQSLNIKSMVSDEELDEVGPKNDKQEDEEVDSLGFSSWCNFNKV